MTLNTCPICGIHSITDLTFHEKRHTCNHVNVILIIEKIKEPMFDNFRLFKLCTDCLLEIPNSSVVVDFDKWSDVEMEKFYSLAVNNHKEAKT